LVDAHGGPDDVGISACTSNINDHADNAKGKQNKTIKESDVWMVSEKHVACCFVTSKQKDKRYNTHHEVGDGTGPAHKNAVGHGYRILHEHQDLQEYHTAKGCKRIQVQHETLSGLNTLDLGVILLFGFLLHNLSLEFFWSLTRASAPK
jgi:hypothetical protein